MWGGEWWYWRKVNGDSSLWEQSGKNFLNTNKRAPLTLHTAQKVLKNTHCLIFYYYGCYNTDVMKKKHGNTGSIVNSRARFDYDLKDEYIAGISLTGAEVKCLRLGRAQMKGAFVTMQNGEAWLNNVQINPDTSTAMHLPEEKQSKARKLLLKKRELAELTKAKDQSLTIVPLKILTKGRYIKVIVSTAKGKKKYDKRQTIKTRETNIDIRRQIKHR